MMSAGLTQAVILAAGRGTRMRDLTLGLPKPMIAVRGKPILQHIVEGLRDAGVERFLIIVGYRADAVTRTFGQGTSLGVAIDYATQEVQNGTGRVIELARSFVGDDPFVLSYGDILVDAINYCRLVRLEPSVEAVITVKQNEDVSKGGAIFVNDRFEVVDVREKPQPGEPTSHWYNAGIYVLRPSIFEFTAELKLSPRGEYELTDALRAMALSGKRIQALEVVGQWADIRDPETLASLNDD